MSDYLPFPQEDEFRGGCKVSWLIYKDKATAEIAAEIAKHNAQLDAARGYDFGFQCPGTIDELKDGRYEVCIS